MSPQGQSLAILGLGVVIATSLGAYGRGLSAEVFVAVAFVAIPLIVIWVASMVGEGKRVGQGAPAVSWLFLFFTALLSWNLFVVPAGSSTDAIGFGFLVTLEI